MTLETRFKKWLFSFTIIFVIQFTLGSVCCCSFTQSHLVWMSIEGSSLFLLKTFFFAWHTCSHEVYTTLIWGMSTIIRTSVKMKRLQQIENSKSKKPPKWWIVIYLSWIWQRKHFSSLRHIFWYQVLNMPTLQNNICNIE